MSILATSSSGAFNHSSGKRTGRTCSARSAASVVYFEIGRAHGLHSSHTEIYTLSLHDALPIYVDLGNKLKRRIQSLVRQTHGPNVLGKIGGFGGLFRVNFRGMREPILVSSI